MADDILAKLKAELKGHLEILVRSKTAAQELRLAIAAIEQSRKPQTEAARAVESTKPSRPDKLVRRGELKRALLDCLRSGIGARSEFEEALKERGIETSPNSISNALHRMTSKREILWDNQRKVYVLLRYAEGPDADATRPLQSNGAADWSSA